MMKKFILEIKINDFLGDIKEYCENAIEYLSNPYTKFTRYLRVYHLFQT